MSTRATSIALFVAALAGLLAFYALRSHEPLRSLASPDPARPAPIPRESIPLSRSEPIGAPDSLNAQETLAPAAIAASNLPTPMARALDDVGMRADMSRPAALDNERAFAAEAVDASWAPRMEADIYDAIAQLNGPAIVTVQVECRTSQCRIQMTQQIASVPREQRADAVMGFHAKVSKALGYDPGAVMLAVDGSGIATSLVYLPRRDTAK